jgi:hypothetical protein
VIFFSLLLCRREDTLRDYAEDWEANPEFLQGEGLSSCPYRERAHLFSFVGIIGHSAWAF